MITQVNCCVRRGQCPRTTWSQSPESQGREKKIHFLTRIHIQSALNYLLPNCPHFWKMLLPRFLNEVLLTFHSFLFCSYLHEAQRE